MFSKGKISITISETLTAAVVGATDAVGVWVVEVTVGIGRTSLFDPSFDRQPVTAKTTTTATLMYPKDTFAQFFNMM